MSDLEWDDKVMVHNWPECGPGAVSFEDLYQAFRARFLREQNHHEDQCEGGCHDGCPHD